MPKAKTGRPSSQGLKVVSRKNTTALYLRGTVRGRSIFESAGTDNRVLAEEARATREAELYRGALHGEKKTVTFAEAALKYLKRPAEGRGISQNTKWAIARIVQHFGPTLNCRQIDQAAIDSAATALCRPGSKAVTILRSVITPTRAVLSFASLRGWCDAPRFDTPKGGGKRTDWFKPDEAEAMIAAAADHLKPMLIFLFLTGARVGEAVALDWQNVDLKYARATLLGQGDGDGRGGTKNEDDRIVDLPPRLVAALANLPGERKGPVFRAPLGNPKSARVQMVPYKRSGGGKSGTGGGQIKRSWATALAGAGISRHLTPHHARHTWATWHYLIHKDLVKLRIDGGWRTTALCERYTKLAPNGMRTEAEAFLAGSVAPNRDGFCAMAVQTPDQERIVA